MKRWIKKINMGFIPLYPFLFGLFPVLFLWNSNRAQEPAYVVIPALLVTVAVLLVINFIAYVIVRDIHRSALLATLFSFCLLTYGQFFNLVGKRLQPYLFPVTAVLLVGLLVWFGIRKVGGPNLTKTLNLIATVLVLFQVASASPYYLSVARLQKVSAHADSDEVSIPVTGGPQRDVYFILLDNYGRQDILQSGSGFDNSALVSALKQRGFVFPDCAQGNYFWTAPVVASILNMNYLDELGIPDKAFAKRGGYDQMAPLIQDSAVIKKFRSYGYHVVTFRGFMGLIDIQNTDTYISYDKDKSYLQRLETAKFQDLYLRTTILSPLNQQYKIYPDWLAKHGPQQVKDMLPKQLPLEPQFEEVYKQNLYAFDALNRIPNEIQGPKFVYAHIYTAHWPFMMAPDGNLRLPFSQELTTEGYVDGIRYTNSRVLGAIDSILASAKASGTEPVIILQGDHSDIMDPNVEWAGTDRVKILSAFYLPDGGNQDLYDNISPVNNFRLVFRHYFGEDLPLLPDINHFLNPQTKQVEVAPSTCISDLP